MSFLAFGFAFKITIQLQMQKNETNSKPILMGKFAEQNHQMTKWLEIGVIVETVARKNGSNEATYKYTRTISAFIELCDDLVVDSGARFSVRPYSLYIDFATN